MYNTLHITQHITKFYCAICVAKPLFLNFTLKKINVMLKFGSLDFFSILWNIDIHILLTSILNFITIDQYSVCEYSINDK